MHVHRFPTGTVHTFIRLSVCGYEVKYITAYMNDYRRIGIKGCMHICKSTCIATLFTDLLCGWTKALWICQISEF